MNGEGGIVSLWPHKGFPRGNQFKFHEQPQYHSNGKPYHHGVEIKQGNPFVIGGENPFEDSLSSHVLLQIGFMHFAL